MDLQTEDLQKNNTLIETVSTLQSRGFDVDFCLLGHKLYCPQSQRFLDMADCVTVEAFPVFDNRTRSYRAV